MDSHELKQLLAASQDVSCAPKLLPRLPQVGAHAAQLLELGRTETGAHVVEDVLLCFRILRNVAAAGPVTCEALLRLGLLDLIRTALELVATATIALDWHLPAVVSQALANLCNGSTCGAAAAWAALFPLHYNILAHVNAGGLMGWVLAKCVAWRCACCCTPRGCRLAVRRRVAGSHMSCLAVLLQDGTRGCRLLGRSAGQRGDDGPAVQSTQEAAGKGRDALRRLPLFVDCCCTRTWAMLPGTLTLCAAEQ